MTWFIGQSILIIAAAFLLGIAVGWLIWGRLLRPAPTDSGAGEGTPEVAPAATEMRPAAEPGPEPEPEPASDEPALVELTRVEAASDEPAPVEPTPVEPTPVEPTPVEPTPVEAAPVAAAATEPAQEEAHEAAGAVLAAQATASEIEQIPDHLERIEGIGPKMAGALHKAGIRTYAQLAAADQAALRQAIEAEGLRFAPSIVTWSRQARLLADGDEAGFSDLTRRLVAGRDEGRE